MSNGDIAVVPNLRGRIPSHRTTSRPAAKKPAPNLREKRVDPDVEDVMNLQHQETKEEKKPKVLDGESKSNYLVIVLAAVVVILVIAIVWYVLRQNKEKDAQRPPAAVPPHVLQPGAQFQQLPPGAQFQQLPPGMPFVPQGAPQGVPHPQQQPQAQQQPQGTSQAAKPKPSKAELEAVLNRMTTIKESPAEEESKKLAPSARQLEQERENNIPMPEESPVTETAEESSLPDLEDAQNSPEPAESAAELTEEEMEQKMAEAFYNGLEDNANAEE